MGDDVELTPNDFRDSPETPVLLGDMIPEAHVIDFGTAVRLTPDVEDVPLRSPKDVAWQLRPSVGTWLLPSGKGRRNSQRFFYEMDDKSWPGGTVCYMPPELVHWIKRGRPNGKENYKLAKEKFDLLKGNVWSLGMLIMKLFPYTLKRSRNGPPGSMVIQPRVTADAIPPVSEHPGTLFQLVHGGERRSGNMVKPVRPVLWEHMVKIEQVQARAWKKKQELVGEQPPPGEEKVMSVAQLSYDGEGVQMMEVVDSDDESGETPELWWEWPTDERTGHIPLAGWVQRIDEEAQWSPEAGEARQAKLEELHNVDVEGRYGLRRKMF